MPDAIITSTASTFGTISGTFAADQSTIVGTVAGSIVGNLSGSVGVPGPAGPGVPAGGTAGQYLQKIDGVDYNTDWVTLNLSAYAPLNSPAFTGNPTAPTAALGDNDTSLATTAFVQQELASGTAVAKNLEVYVRNQTGSTLAAGAIVYINGATGNRPTVTLAQANNDANSAQTMGFVKTAIANNGFGYVIVRGEVENLDTSALTEGVQLYLSPTTPGAWTTTKPSAPQHLVYVGIVIRSHPTQGVILVAVQNGYELNELHDVAISSPTNGQVLKYNSSTGLWYNGTDSSGVAWGGITGTLSSQTDLQTALDGKYSTSNPAGYITSSALSPYLTSATAASIYQTIAGMSSYLTTSAAASTYYPLTNPSGYITSSALAGYATESWVTSQGYLTDAPSDGNQYARKDGAWDIVSAPASYISSVSLPLDVTSGNLSINLSDYAPLDNPAFTGFPTAPTRATSDNDVNIATTAFVKAQGYITSSALSPYLLSSTAASTYQTIAGMSSYLTTSAAASTYLTQSNAASTYFTIANAANKADLASPVFTGDPRAPTPATADNDTSIATTAFVKAQGYLTSAPVTSVAGKTGAVTLDVADVSGAAPLASPTFTGTPSLPTGTTAVTQSAGNNTTAVATTAFVTAAVPSFGVQADINDPVSTTKAASIDNVRELLLSPGYQMFYQGVGVNGTSGAGAAVNANSGRWKEYVSPNSGVAGHAKGVYDTTASGIGFAGYQRGANLTSRNWSKKIWMSGRCMIGHFSLNTYNGSANTFARISLGGYDTIVAGNMASNRRGIGWRLQGGGSSALELQVCNGTTVTNVTSSFTPVLKECFDWEIYSDGAGNVTLFVNDSQVATTTAGPTGTQGSGLYMEGVDTTSSSTAAFIMNNLGTKIFVAI